MSQICQSDSAFCQIRNKPSTFWKQFVNFCQRGEISPNLVTLLGIDFTLAMIQAWEHRYLNK